MKLIIGIIILSWCGLAMVRKLKGSDTFFDWQLMSTRKIDPKNPITFFVDLIFLFAMMSGGIFSVFDFFRSL